MATAARGRAGNPGMTGGLSALTEDDLGSEAQRDRRKRILDATIALATKGGYDIALWRWWRRLPPSD